MSRFHFIKQHDAMQCGIACLAMICRYHGKNYSLATLSEICHATNEGVSLLSISDAAEQLGMHTIIGYSSVAKLSKVTLPCILHWNQNHFVVLYKIKRGKYYVADPGKGLIKYSGSEFVQHWISICRDNEDKGVAMFIKPTSLFYDKIDDPNDAPRSFKFLLGYINRFRKYFGSIILGLFIGCLLQLMLPFLTQSIVDIGVTHQDINFIWLVLAGQLMLTISRTIIDFIRRWLLMHISMRINISLISDFLLKLLKLPMSFFDTKLMGDLLQRMNDHSRIEKFLTNQVLNVMFSLLSFLIFGIVLFIYNKLIFSVFLIGSVLYAGWMLIFLSKRKVIDYEMFEKQAINNNYTYQFITSMQEIKLQDCEKRRRWEWEDIQTDLFQVQMKSMKLQQTQEAGSIFINEVKNIVITVLSATAVIYGEMTLGMMLAVQYIIGQLNSPVEQLMNFLYSMQDVKISLERINEIHGSRNEENTSRDRTEFKDCSHDIVFNNVSFKYDPHSLTNIIENVSFFIPSGKVTAIVGASGSGKTTLIKLMLGFYPIIDGHIHIGDTDINTLNLKWLRRQCGVVMQDGVIFSESIARNIAVDDDEIDKERLLWASEIANIKEYILSLPLRFDTKIGQDGMGLSQGQKQRILIARAVYKSPEFIFLDEATNALDAKNERAIVENLDEFYKGRTVVVVAHRLSTVKNADQIIVLDSGKVVEIGNHTTLIAKQGTYYNLVKNQLELGN
ncbi:MAG: peptidase domain-containing ABC transporter [Alphaproteobacteria bacterium]|nr:peptidase domain-containing ABC transporter [Alphaproteobacteria bacterium]